MAYKVVVLPGDGASVTPPVGPATLLGHLDLLWITGMSGAVSMECHPAAEVECVTNFSGDAALARKWDCYVHEYSASTDCPNDGP